MNIRPQTLEGFCRALFRAAGMPDDDAGIVAHSVVDANLAGHDSHGVMLVPRYLRELRAGIVRTHCRLTIERATPNTARIDAHDSQGHVAGRKVTEMALEKARTGGVATVVVHHIGHVGRLGTYVEMVAAEGYVAIATINNHGSGVWVAPFGGADRRLSPNPLGIGAPTGGPHPLVLDISGSVVAAGKVLVQKSKNEPVPLGWILDHAGKPTTDAAALLGPPTGALLPLGGTEAGHKGYALAFLMDVLGGALSGAGCSRDHEPAFRNGFFLTVLCIENFVDLAEFTAEVERLIAWVKAAPKAHPSSEILYPGEFEARSRERRAAGIPLPEQVWESLCECGQSLAVKAPPIPPPSSGES